LEGGKEMNYKELEQLLPHAHGALFVSKEGQVEAYWGGFAREA